MKIKLLFAALVLSTLVNAQSTWTQKANFGGTARYRAVGFSIGTKGYIGTGNYEKVFWEWDQATDTWTQKADFGGAGKDWATGFSIGNKGYIGTGVYAADFWEWDQVTNVWTQKATLGPVDTSGNPLIGRVGAVGFSIGTKGYIGTGNGSINYNDLWEYDPANDTWTQKANIGSVGRYGGVGFSIGTKGYIGTGTSNSGLLSDFWEWNQTTDTWTQKANLPAGGRHSATGFSIGAKGYIGTGLGTTGVDYKDFWEWDQASNTWSQKPDFTGGKRCRAVGFSIGNLGYIGTGSDSSNNSTQDFWEFNSSCSVSPASICMVTVDSTNKNVVVWEKPVLIQPIDSFRIYREISSVYNHVGSVPFSALSIFTDMTSGVNPNIAAYKYKISVKDTCGNETVLSSFHKTIHVSMSPAVPCGYNLIWNDYLGFPITQYLIYRDSAKTGWKVIDSLSFGNTSWTDGTCYAVSDTVAYLIEALNPAGCSPSIKNPQPMSGYSSARSNTQQNYANTSVFELSDVSYLHIYPNPTSGIFVIANEAKQSHIEIYNVLGEQIQKLAIGNRQLATNSQTTIDLSDQPSGVYFVKMKTADGVAAKKIIKK